MEVKWAPPDQGSASNYTVSIVPMDASGQLVTEVTADLSWTFYEREAGQTYNVTVVSNLGGVYSIPVVRHVTTSEYDGMFNHITIIVNTSQPVSMMECLLTILQL